MASHGKGSLLSGIDRNAPAKDAGKPARGEEGAGKRKLLALVAVIAIIALSIFIIANFVGEGTAAGASERRTLIDAETGEVFENYRVPEGVAFPYENKKTGKKTLFPAERCHWTKDGKAKLEPTYVLLNEYAGKSGQTICPDCGRPVRSHNPLPPSNLFPQN